MTCSFADGSPARHVALALGLAALVGCDRTPARARGGEIPPSTARPSNAADTVVRRVYRVTPRPAALQRVTGPITADESGRALDSVLAVRVYDQRGNELGGAAVRWTMARIGPGASLRVINASTDSFGISRASFTPGRSADPQSAIAEVAGVGAIDFAVTVRPVSIRVLPDRDVLWAGEEAVFGAELKDQAGNVLPGGTLSWATTDTSVVRIQLQDPSHTRVTGALAGVTGLVGWIDAGALRDTARVVVRPVVVGRFVTLDGRPPPPLLLEVRSFGSRDSIPVVGGAFTKRVELPFEADVDLIAGERGDSAEYHPVRLLVTPQRGLQNLTIVLVPRVVRVEGGTYAGRSVRVDARVAMQRTGRVAPFWRLVPNSGRGARKLLGWRTADFPLRIAFDRSRSSEPIAAADSVAFWAIARQMEADLGASLFAPAGMTADPATRGIVPVEIASQTSEAHTFVSWAQEGDANNGVMLFRREATLRDPHVVTHELTHLLGFGHTSGWATVAQPAGSTEPRLTPEDVAYIQLAMRLRRLQELTGARPGLPVAIQ